MITVKDLLAMEIDIDVCDDYDESCYIAFCGPAELTEEGERTFADALDVPVDLYNDVALLECGNEEKTAACKRLFYSLAGYCGVSEWDKWFKEV